MSELLDRVLGRNPPPFALLVRPETHDQLDLLVGTVSAPDTLAGIPRDGKDVLVLVPFRQIAERGFAAVDDGTPLVAMSVDQRTLLPLATALAGLPEVQPRLTAGGFDTDDERYARTVRDVIDDEIGAGTGANFVIRRTYTAEIADYELAHALTLFRRLVEREYGAYWIFLVHTGTRTLVGATPERHLSLRGGVAVMNPISGTYRYPTTGPTLPGVLAFLRDIKETDELYMVLDEELKMMARVCAAGGRVAGPYLKEMARLAHTEYLIEGVSTLRPHEILAETMFAPTVTGSPLENACRVIARHEPTGRGYYSGVVALIDGDGRGMDSAILIRTADLDQTGRMRIGVGATLVRHSDPAAEAAETHAKVAGLLGALESSAGPFAGHPAVRASLRQRNEGLAGFWFADRAAPASGDLAGRDVLVVDMEDTFTAMIAHQLRSLGLRVTVREFDEEYGWADQDLVLLGPGPGDPRDVDHPRIAHLHAATARLLAERRPFLAVCLSHQVLALGLGLDVVPARDCGQGARREVDLFGVPELVGFYNTFTAVCATDRFEAPGIGQVEVARDPVTGEVHALRGPRFSSMQFHAESVLTQDGPRVLAARVREVLE